MNEPEVGSPAPFSLLLRLFGDPEMSEIFGEVASYRLWVAVEVELARAQARLGVISAEAALDIEAAARQLESPPAGMWVSSANVGYPILSVVRQLDGRTTGQGSGRVHLGATTQDIMDTALAIQLRDATDVMITRLRTLGDALAVLVSRHGSTVMAGRTHAQQAVPITLGMKFAVILDQLGRCIDRLGEERPRVGVLSLFGAAGTSAAFGTGSASLRSAVAEGLGLESTEVPWHVARDSIFAQASHAVAAAEVCSRLAREVIDLSRTEIGEVMEPGGVHRGASSTMPQKANPILSEAIVGFAASANAQLSALGRAMEAGHERSAGEWQIEWHVIPQVFALASAAVLRAGELAEQLVVDEAAIERNLVADHGLLMAEAYMIALSGPLGRENAHDCVSAACERTRRENRPLLEVLVESLAVEHRTAVTEIQPSDYIGMAETICVGATAAWTARGAATQVRNARE